LSTRQKYLEWLDKSSHVANLKTSVAVQGFVLVVGTLVITHSRTGEGLGFAILLTGYHVFCGFLANFKYRLACSLIAVPNFLLALAFGYLVVNRRSEEPLELLWFVATFSLAAAVIVLSRVSGVPSQAERSIDSPQDDA